MATRKRFGHYRKKAYSGEKLRDLLWRQIWGLDKSHPLYPARRDRLLEKIKVSMDKEERRVEG